HDYRNDSTASRMRSLYVLHLSLSVAIPAIQPRLRLSGTNRLRSSFHGGQRMNVSLLWSLGTVLMTGKATLSWVRILRARC
ncbi:MAG: hypothetical protein KZQ59_03290, partial [Candidatus Thiodiazotropha sp. (ex Lucinoma aequizonata)]|nr:hypothetical protein [Candidatus Thiodiazotropha sp. (ex Lucinoma aequizonata)]